MGQSCDKFVVSGADLLYWRRKREQWRSIAERAPDDTTADQMLKARTCVTFAAAARRSGVSRTFLYEHDRARALVEAAMSKAADDNNRLKKQVRQLTNENNDFKNKLSAPETTYGSPTNASPCSKPSSRPQPNDGSRMERATVPWCRRTPSGTDTRSPDLLRPRDPSRFGAKGGSHRNGGHHPSPAYMLSSQDAVLRRNRGMREYSLSAAPIVRSCGV
ncbi:DUF6262 family protein [Paractinoplanes brasiliensis]|nr:DUF6262 family protein [Actinoplanes brasiliensis]GID30787.1 hypothetical protein Abr02nite_57700 [Actinoplanes brasiliensis]